MQLLMYMKDYKLGIVNDPKEKSTFTMTPVEKFCEILRQRSIEHRASAMLLFGNKHYGQVISVLRQELDSLVRTIFLLSKNLKEREHFINQTLNNQQWTLPESKTKITDRNMIDLANRLNGWTNSVYKLGCAFIHLSPFADYNNQNPFSHLPFEEVDNIKRHIHSYHGFPLESELNMQSIIPYLMHVFNKVSNNLGYYIEQLNSNKTVSVNDL